ncbi:MAG: hypothetical protein COB02_16945 [Candidatus Cloacimonadota bacterium]|nr:MAG: hypothetical protein COB02_16945 [Candidatus Cloacimonadota bacterium]
MINIDKINKQLNKGVLKLTLLQIINDINNNECIENITKSLKSIEPMSLMVALEKAVFKNKFEFYKSICKFNKNNRTQYDQILSKVIYIIYFVSSKKSIETIEDKSLQFLHDKLLLEITDSNINNNLNQSTINIILSELDEDKFIPAGDLSKLIAGDGVATSTDLKEFDELCAELDKLL